MSESSFLNPGRALAAAGVHEGMRVAEFGSSSGFFTRAAARLVGAGGSVWAADAHAEMLARVKNLAQAEGLNNVEVVRGNIEHVGGTHLPEGTFDFVIIANALFGIECKPCLAQEAARVLKRGGRVLVVDWRGSYGGLGPHPRQVVGKVDALKVFEAQGFVLEGDIPPGRAGVGEYHWGCILKKR